MAKITLPPISGNVRAGLINSNAQPNMGLAQGLAMAGEVVGQLAEKQEKREEERTRFRENVFNTEYRNDSDVLRTKLDIAYEQNQSNPNQLLKSQQELIEEFSDKYQNGPIGYSDEFSEMFQVVHSGVIEKTNVKNELQYDRALDLVNKISIEDDINAATLNMIRFESDKNSAEYKAANGQRENAFAEYERDYGEIEAKKIRNETINAGLLEKTKIKLKDPNTPFEEISGTAKSLLNIEGVFPTTYYAAKASEIDELSKRLEAGEQSLGALDKAIAAYSENPEENRLPDESFLDEMKSRGVPEGVVAVAASRINKLGPNFVEDTVRTADQQENDSYYINTIAQFKAASLAPENLLIRESEYRKNIDDIINGKGSHLTDENKSFVLAEYMNLAGSAARDGNKDVLGMFRNYVAENLTKPERNEYMRVWDLTKKFVARNNLRVSGETATKFFQELDDNITSVASSAPESKTRTEFEISLLSMIVDDNLRINEAAKFDIDASLVEPIGQMRSIGRYTLEHMGNNIWKRNDGVSYKLEGGEYLEQEAKKVNTPSGINVF
tara:strand:- start:4829 stop:6493 length:1665 start_codon:yes stop_codon:yes gene_type:complete